MAYFRLNNQLSDSYSYALAPSVFGSLAPLEYPAVHDALTSADYWPVWFAAVRSVDAAALKDVLPACFHDLLDGLQTCPECGAPLDYRAAQTCESLVEVCPSCGHICTCLSPREHERLMVWRAQAQELGLPFDHPQAGLHLQEAKDQTYGIVRDENGQLRYDDKGRIVCAVNGNL